MQAMFLIKFSKMGSSLAILLLLASTLTAWGQGPLDSDEGIDNLSQDEIEQLTESLAEMSPVLTIKATSGTIVAEGDSWFDYSPAGLDIIFWLRWDHGYKIRNLADAGDTLDNMAWGTEHKRWKRKPPQLTDDTLPTVRRYRPRVVLLSGGGNDVAGDELSSYLNHISSGKGPIREEYLRYMLNDYYKSAYRHMIKSLWAEDPNIHVLTHGYGYADPSGKPVRVLGFSFAGPWLRPVLTAKGYEDEAQRDKIVHELIDSFNDMLKELDEEMGERVHYIDLRNVISERDDWANELHLKSSVYRRVAEAFAAKIYSIEASDQFEISSVDGTEMEPIPKDDEESITRRAEYLKDFLNR